jgi:pimeloyl-ACP methyl ester carboxylesterase
MAIRARPAVGARRGTAILVPPWKVPALALVSGWARLLARSRLDVWTVIAPQHLERATARARRGDAFLSPDLPRMRAAFEQLVLELRLLVALARRRGEETAVVGLSLGALAAAIAATGPERIDRLVLVAPPADLADIVAQTPIGRRYLRLAAGAGAPLPQPDLLAPMLAPFRAAARPPSAAEVLVAVGREDRIALAPGALGLARAWGTEPRVYRRGHLTLLFGCRPLRRDVAAFLQREILRERLAAAR